MINFNYYTGSSFDFYKKAVENKTDKDGKAVLKQMEDRVKGAYELYDNTFEKHNIHTLSPSTSFSENEKAELYGLYGSNKKIVKLIREWLELNNKPTYLKICPYCTLNSANTTEHILPKQKYPEYAVHAKNLLPCCSECNSSKGENVRNEQGKPIILNFYYDILPPVQYLFVIISFDAKGFVDFEYRLENKNGINAELYDLIVSHYGKLGLPHRFKTRAVSIYTEIENSLIVDAKWQGIDRSLLYLRERTMMDADAYGLNHWKVVLKLALADSKEYKDYLLKKIK